ncbi:peptidylprolyl isomerase [Calycomorphotria hydatis]|uniref:Peptidyl-prolyl cis-trans isomerase n=1 Tax=Calycomorphotria hydatis TaxID=2528027 RepID=A0A517TAP4_9PLAN|nr:peptidylprolyl isomerase [Calycomorphotria hydatis]QDT65444.1 Putative bifunctional phosphatase/peptidyl-prolyl cis-trans isomerase [Calycomorphotria hydatis]
MAGETQAAVEAALAELDLDNKNYQVHLETNEGTIRLDLYPDKAPGHVSNFLGLAKSGFYDGLVFHRVIEGFMIQGGCPQGTGTGGPGYHINAEFNDTPHVAGVLSMARSSDPNSAGSQFFICLDQHTHLDGQYTAFGKTADDDSMNVVSSIGGTPTDGRDRPQDDKKIVKATVVEV